MSSTSKPMRGWVLLLESTSGPDFDHGRDLAHEARRLAVEFGDRDLELCALGQIGTIHIEGARSTMVCPFSTRQWPVR